MPMRFAHSSGLASLLVALALPFTLGCPPERGEPSRDAAALDDQAHGSVSLETAIAIAEELSAGEEALDPAMDAAGNAAIVQGNAAVAMGTCGTVSLSGTTVTVTFAAGGCTLPSGIRATGAISLSATVAAGTATVDVDFASVSIGTYSLDGTVSLSTTNGTTYSAMVDLTSEGRTVVGDVTVSASLTMLSLSGSLTTTASGSVARDVSIAGLVWNRGDCYPSEGTVSVSVGMATQTITFDRATADTGVVAVTFGRIETTAQLPAYGSCPVL